MEKKKRRSRRAHLNDFHQNIRGEYIYTGKMYAFRGNKEAYSRYVTYCVTDAVMIFLFSVLQECFDPVPVSRFFVNIILWLAQTASAGILLYTSVCLAAWKNPLRAYRYERSAKTLEGKVNVTMGASFLAALAMILFLLIKGTEGKLWMNLIRPLLSLSAGYTAFRLRKTVKEAEFEEVPNPDGVKVAPADMPKL
ncbi:MAG: hypothetical protein IJL98_10580 [Lachnospiraceae bacterium]|nr:hypothetical protein [Lachnospiraceae bacterium]